MRRARALVVVLGVGVAVVLAGAATSTARIVSGPPQIDWDPSFDRETQGAPLPALPAEASGGGVPWTIEFGLMTILLAGIAVLLGRLLWAVVRAWRDRPAARWRRRKGPGDFAVLDPAEVAATVAADAAAQRAALERGSPRNAIVECWLRLEAVIVDAGLPRRPADTSTDLVERTLAAHVVDPVAIGRLAALYREARFSTHAMGEAQRGAAIAALDAVHAGLRDAIAERAVTADVAGVSVGPHP